MSKETEEVRGAEAGRVERRVGRQCAGGECKCSFRQYMVGDGCDVCNPAKALEYARETMADLQAHRDMLAAALHRLIAVYEVSHSPKQRQECWEQARKALDFDA